MLKFVKLKTNDENFLQNLKKSSVDPFDLCISIVKGKETNPTSKFAKKLYDIII